MSKFPYAEFQGIMAFSNTKLHHSFVLASKTLITLLHIVQQNDLSWIAGVLHLFSSIGQRVSLQQGFES